jgi:hypothetical protein
MGRGELGRNAVITRLRQDALCGSTESFTCQEFERLSGNSLLIQGEFQPCLTTKNLSFYDIRP